MELLDYHRIPIIGQRALRLCVKRMPGVQRDPCPHVGQVTLPSGRALSSAMGDQLGGG